MNRKELRLLLIDQVEWNSGGYGFGICSVANSMMWAMDEPSADKPDLKSTVAICGDPKKYTDEELEKIVAFAKRRDKKYDEMVRYRRGCNMILIGKEEDNAPSHRWMRKRLTWNRGPMHSPTLDEAIAFMEK
jgi:hypothetical protein